MIDYELAKELKESGFPLRQSKALKLVYFNKFGESVSHGVITEIDDIEIIIPTLEELIKACKDFASLCATSSGIWTAEVWSEELLPVEGLTPEEAVARLWLAINKK